MQGVAKLVASVALLLTASSCVQLAWERHDLNTKVEPGQEQGLEEGIATLGDCLQELGAPLLAWELSETRYAIAYGWDHQREYGIKVSVPVADSGGSASFNYDDVASKLHGVVFLFDVASVHLVWVLLLLAEGQADRALVGEDVEVVTALGRDVEHADGHAALVCV